uniref:Uncharacterized protein n=1 Tax=Anopheles culicifacies TaxID=139723 RepID=A0A182MEP3_9DIPT
MMKARLLETVCTKSGPSSTNGMEEPGAIKMSEEPKRREWPFFNLMDVYFSDQVNDPTLRLFSSTKRFDSDTLDDAQFDDEIMNSTAAAAIAAAAAASAAAANAASQHKIKNELIASHGHSGGNMLDISDIIGDEHGGSHLTTSGVSSLSTTSSSSSARDEASSLNSSPTSHMSSGPTNGPCGPEMRKMSNGPTADFSALLAAANSHTNGTLHSNSSALSSTDRDTDYDDYAERSSLYDGGNNHLKSLNQKLLHQMNEHHNIDQRRRPFEDTVVNNRMSERNMTLGSCSLYESVDYEYYCTLA